MGDFGMFHMKHRLGMKVILSFLLVLVGISPTFTQIQPLKVIVTPYFAPQVVVPYGSPASNGVYIEIGGQIYTSYMTVYPQGWVLVCSPYFSPVIVTPNYLIDYRIGGYWGWNRIGECWP